MKKLLSALCIAVLSLLLSTCAWAEPEPVDYLALLSDAAVAGDREAGLEAAEGWNAEEGNTPVDYDELFLLSKLITWEAGSVWLTEEFRMCIGEVVLNRVASPEFPDTLEGVVYQYGQFENTDSLAFRYSLLPTREAVDAALRLLLGERQMQPLVVFAGHAIQGPVHTVFIDEHYGRTYFCETNFPELYELEDEANLPTPRCEMDADAI